MGKKEGTDAKRLRPKADQAVSSVSAAPALVDEYRPPLNQRETELVSEALVYFSDLVFWRSSEHSAHQKILCVSCRQIRMR